MPSKDEIARRKALGRTIARKESAAAEVRMPISKQDLLDLFDFLDRELGNTGCAHSMEHTRKFLDSRKLPVDIVAAWLGEYGGYCDCEVLANVEDRWGS